MSEEQGHSSAADVFNVDDAALENILMGKDEAPPAPPVAPPVEVPAKIAAPVEEPEVEEPEGDEEVEEELPEGDEEEVEEEVEAEPPKKDNKPPLTKFQVFDAEGEVEAPTDLKFTYKANGKLYEDVPLEKVVQLAQMGHYNHEREQSLKSKEQEATRAVEAQKATEAERDAIKSAVIEMLDDPDTYDRAREAYLNANTPEAKARRLEQENAELRQRQVEEQEGTAVGRFVERELAPYITGLLETNPSVSEYELYGKYSELIAPLLVKGRLPASRLAQVAAIVERDLTHWVKGIHESRNEKEVKRKKELVREKEQTSLAKRKIARTTRPKGVPVPARQAVKDIESADDFLSTYLPTK